MVAGPNKCWMQLTRLLIFASWFAGCCVSIHLTQLLGAPLYFINKDYYYAWMALTKQSFGKTVTGFIPWVQGVQYVRVRGRFNPDSSFGMSGLRCPIRFMSA